MLSMNEKSLFLVRKFISQEKSTYKKLDYMILCRILKWSFSCRTLRQFHPSLLYTRTLVTIRILLTSPVILFYRSYCPMYATICQGVNKNLKWTSGMKCFWRPLLHVFNKHHDVSFHEIKWGRRNWAFVLFLHVLIYITLTQYFSRGGPIHWFATRILC